MQRKRYYTGRRTGDEGIANRQAATCTRPSPDVLIPFSVVPPSPIVYLGGERRHLSPEKSGSGDGTKGWKYRHTLGFGKALLQGGDRNLAMLNSGVDLTWTGSEHRLRPPWEQPGQRAARNGRFSFPA